MDIATLGLRIDSSDAKTAADDLAKLPTVGERVEKAFAVITKAAKDFGQGFKQGAGEALDEYKKGAEGAAGASDKAEKSLKNTTKAAKDQEGVLSGLSSTIKNLVAGYLSFQTINGVIRSVVQNTINAENEQAQLDAVLRSTGESAGWSAKQLNAMAESLAQSSTFSAGAINSAQTRLLSYTGIVGEQFPEALQAVIDMSARTGMALEQSAETMGRALDIPSEGLTALSRQGFRFTEDQKKMVEQFERTGHVAKAQAIILDAVKTSYGGAASAARDTFGGAVADLRNSLQELTTGKDGSFSGTTEALKSLTETINSDATKNAFDSIVAAVARTVKVLAEGTGWVIKFTQSTAEGLSKFFNGTDNPLERIDTEVASIRTNIESLQQTLNGPKQFGLPLSADEIDNLNTQLAEQERRLKDLLGMREILNKDPAASGADNGIGTPKKTKRAPVAITRSKEEEATIKALLDSQNRALAAQQEEFDRRDDEARAEAHRRRKENLDGEMEQRRQYFAWLDQQQDDEIKQGQEAARLYDENAKKMKDINKELSMTFSSAFEDAIVHGKSFRDVLDGIAQDLIRITVRQNLTKPVADAVSNINWGSVFNFNAKGGVYDSPSLSSYRNGVYDSPKLFAFAKGAGVFAEAGPEAIMPLTRTPTGELGVRSLGGAGGGQIVLSPTYNITVDSRSDRAQTVQDIDRAVRNGNAQLVDQLRRQGSL